jgi:hypothetical protein
VNLINTYKVKNRGKKGPNYKNLSATDQMIKLVGYHTNSSHRMNQIAKDDKCASCNVGDSTLKRCAACKIVQYYSVRCQSSHRKEHKPLCRLFQMPPSNDEDCPVCFLPMPLIGDGATYLVCCGKYICGGCFMKYLKIDVYRSCCPFCRCHIPVYDISRSTRDNFNTIAERVTNNDPAATFHMASAYANGLVETNYNVAFGLFKRAAHLGHVTAHREIGTMLFLGQGTTEDIVSAKRHWGMAAMNGDYFARYSLAMVEADSIKRFRHLSISASQGHKESMEYILRNYNASGNVVMTRDINSTLRSHQDCVERISSVDRVNHEIELSKP